LKRFLTAAETIGVQSGEKQGKVTKLSKNEVLMLNIGSMCTGARVLAVRCCVSGYNMQKLRYLRTSAVWAWICIALVMS
jgi:translation initiation factor 2 gamma subunit (eIF-2gamma)